MVTLNHGPSRLPEPRSPHQGEPDRQAPGRTVRVPRPRPARGARTGRGPAEPPPRSAVRDLGGFVLRRAWQLLGRRIGRVLSEKNRRRAGRVSRRGVQAVRRWVDQGSRPGPRRAGLNVTAAVSFALVARYVSDYLPAACVGLFLVLGSAVVRPRHLVRDAALIGVIVLVVLALIGQQFWSLLPVILVLLGAVLLGWLQRREREAADSGLRDATSADAVLIDLRNEMLLRSAGPDLPAGWRFDTDLRPAYGDTFSGDFLVTQQSGPGSLEVVLVDVSGNGYQAGARALLLAGAMRALLDTVPPSGFLAAANHHVVQLSTVLGTEEGFATAVHISLDLAGGGFAVHGAGHPPVAHYHAGSGRWEVLDAEQGPALGLLAGASYPAITGCLGRGDALMLYTDGLVESRRLDVGRGIDRLVGRADPLIARGVEGAAARITGAIRTEEGDDRALVIIRRAVTDR